MSVKNVECAWHLVTSQYLILVRLPACNRKKKNLEDVSKREVMRGPGRLQKQA